MIRGTVCVDSGQVALMPQSSIERWKVSGTGSVLYLAMWGRDGQTVADRCKEIGLSFMKKGRMFLADVAGADIQQFEDFVRHLSADEKLIVVSCTIRDNSYDRLLIKESVVHPINRSAPDEVSYVVDTRYGDGIYGVYETNRGFMALFTDRIPLSTKAEVVDRVTVNEAVPWVFVDPCYAKRVDLGTIVRLTPGEYLVEHLKTDKGESIALRITK